MRLFPLQFVEDQLDDKHSHLQFISTSRWSVNYWLLFEVEGITYGAYYLAPATEYQEGQECFDTRLNPSTGEWDLVEAYKMRSEPTTKWVVDV